MLTYRPRSRKKCQNDISQEAYFRQNVVRNAKTAFLTKKMNIHKTEKIARNAILVLTISWGFCTFQPDQKRRFFSFSIYK